MMTSCVAIFGLIFLVITNLAIIISFATPYWLESRRLGGKNMGLWADCDDQVCTWVFNHDFMLQRNKPAWWVTTQVMMTVGLALGLLSLIVATIALCCECRGCNSSRVVAGMLVFCFLVIGVAIVVFGVNAHNEYGADVPNKTSQTGGLSTLVNLLELHFSWSFWLAIGSAGSALFTSIVYACEGRRQYQ